MKKILPILLVSVVALSQGLPVYTTLRPDPSFGAASWFGWSLATGDFNGDGIPDIAVGAPRSNILADGDMLEAAGRVDIFFGPIPAHFAYPDVVISGISEGDQFGISLSTAGDFNGDGYEDLLVGANVVERKGGAYVFFGGPPFGGSADVFFLGEEIVDNFGYSCTDIGDQNGDGYDDVLVAALYNDAIGPRTGRCYIYFGAAMHDGTPDFIITGLDSLDDFGTCVSGPFDQNGDGWPDFVVGAVQAGGYWFKPGAGYLFHGGPLLDGVPELTLSGAHPMEFFGNSVAALGDFNGNGFDDAVFAGYNHHAPPDSSVGRIIIAYGGSGATEILTGNRPRQSFGGEVASAGDIDFDGFCEFAVSMTYDPSGDSAGFVEIYGQCRFGDTIRVDTTCWNPAPLPNSWFGYRMLGSDDVTGDGMRNFAVADPMFEGAGFQGAVYLYKGWRDYWPIEAEFISPTRGIVSACPRQEFKIRFRHPTGFADLQVVLQIETEEFWRTYTLDSTSLFMEDESTLVFSPAEDWDGTRYISCVLDSAYKTTTGESIESRLIGGCYFDNEPPDIYGPGSYTGSDDRYPTFVWSVEDYSPNRVDTSTLIVTCGTDTVRPFIYEVVGSGITDQIAVTLSDFGIVPAHGETITVCLDNVMDMPDTCGPNIAEPSCISRVFYRAWNTDLTFSSPGLSPTILTLGAELSATDSYNPGLDIFMPPIPDSRVKASFALDDPAFPHFTKLLRDLRASEDDTLEWRVITQGEGEVSVEWIPEELPVGVWLLNGKLDMRAYPEWEFSLGETLSIRFYTGPKVILSFHAAWEDHWKLFSLPIYPETYAPNRIVAAGSYGTYFLYSYSPESMDYYVPERWPTGKGVWLFNIGLLTEYPMMVGGWPIDTMWAQLSPGWNMIAAPFDTTPVSAMATEPPGAIASGTLYGWDFSGGGFYYEPTDLAPLSGYWVAASREAELFAPGEGSALAKGVFAHTFGSPPPPPSLTDIAETKPVPKPDRLTISAHPNPFNSAVKIVVECHSRAPRRPLDESGNPVGAVVVEIFDLSGRCVAQLPDGGTVGEALVASRDAANRDFSETEKREGTSPSPTTRQFTWTPNESLASGVYLVRARFDNRSLSGAEATVSGTAVKRIVHLK